MDFYTEKTAEPPPTNSAVEEEGGTSAITAIHADILQKHILARLDGPSLATAACASTLFRTLSFDERLWTNLCSSTWPSTNSPLLRPVIAAFPGGARSFFYDSFPSPTGAAFPAGPECPTRLISAVDVYYRGELILCKAVETETVSGWFQSSPFRIDLLEANDAVAVPALAKRPSRSGCSTEEDDACRDLEDELALSWIVVDPVQRRAANLSSRQPVSVKRHWLSGEVHARFATVVGGHVQCGILVTCGGGDKQQMQVREVSLLFEGMDGMNMNGKESLPILQQALQGQREAMSEALAKKRYQQFLEMKRTRRERRLRWEGAMDSLCVTCGVCIFTLFLLLLWFR